MAGPYNPPNPYGSYLNLGDYETAALSAFIPSQNIGLTPGTQGLLGRPSGGFNPTPTEYLQRRIQNVNMANYMADIYRQDPRTSAFSSMLLQAMYSNESKRRQAVERWGGMGNVNEMVGFLMNQPGVSGLLGGGPGAIGYGAYAAAASGMGVSGRLMGGDGPLVQQMARAISQQVNRSFYTPTGASIPGMTSGLDRNQMGGLMAYMASQGAFRDINIGSATQTSTGPMFAGNPTQLTAMTDRIKNAAKALGAIMDVYGDADVMQLLGKAQQITGLNVANPQNIPLMGQRLNALRRAGNLAGVDVQTMYDAAASGVALSGALGGRGATPGAVGAFAATQAAMDNMAFASRSLQFGGFTPTFDERKAAYVRDLTKMNEDPLGMRYALFQKVVRAGGIQDERARTEIQRLFDTHVSANTIDMAMRAQGINNQALIRQFGGPEGIMRTANAEDAASFSNWANQNLQLRLGVNMGRKLQGTFGGRTGASAAFTLLQEFEMPTIENLLSTKDPKTMSALLDQSVNARRDPKRYTQAIADVLASQGGNSQQAVTQMRLAEQQIAVDPFGTNFISNQARENAARIAATKIPAFTEDERRGFGKQTFLDALLGRYGGTDERTAFQRISITNPGAVMGGLTGIELPEMNENWTPERQAALVTNVQKEFSKTGSGRNMLKELGLIDQAGKLVSARDVDASRVAARLSSYEQRAILFQGMKEYRIGNRWAFVEAQDIENMQKFGGLQETVRAFKTAKGSEKLAGMDWLMAVGAAATFSDHPLYKIRDRQVVGSAPIGSLNAEEMQRYAAAANNRMAQLDYISFLGVEKFAALTKHNRELGQMAMDNLQRMENAESLTGLPATERDLIRQTKAALGAEGFSPKGSLVMPEGAWSLHGSLKLGDKELELVKTYIAQGKK